MTEEYREFEDFVLVEGPFIELDKRGDAIRQVTLGITRDNFIMAKRVILNYKDHPWVYYDTESDLDTNNLEIEWIVPLCHIKINVIPGEHILNITPSSGRHRYFLMSNIIGNEKRNLSKWLTRIKYIEEDPYGYIQGLYNNLKVPYELYDVGKTIINANSIKNKSTQSNKQTRWKSIALESSTPKNKDSSMTIRQRAKSIVPQSAPSNADTPSLDRQKSAYEQKRSAHQMDTIVEFRDVGSQVNILPKKKSLNCFCCK